MLNNFLSRLVFVLGLIALSTVPLSAKNLLATAFGAPQFFTTTGYLKFNGGGVGGVYSGVFVVKAPTTVMISFSAVCSTRGTGKEFTTVRILLDGIFLYPTNNLDDAFCSVAGNASELEGLDRHTIVTSKLVTTGAHGIQIQITPRNGGVSRIDNVTLLVWE